VSYPTILSGDIDNNDATTNGIVTDTDNIVGDNSYNVVTSSGNNNLTYFDGFIITAGLANGSNGTGGGMYLNGGGNPVLKNLTFIGNRALGGGGGLYSTGSSPSLENISFMNNSSGFHGGGMYNEDNENVSESVSLNRVLFSGNLSETNGG
jgi:predicted outer membrane repeat protein